MISYIELGMTCYLDANHFSSLMVINVLTRVYAKTRFCSFDLQLRTVVRGSCKFDLRL